MFKRYLPLSLSLLVALGAATGASAQNARTADAKATALPVWNNTDGKLEGVLLLEPTGEASAGARWRFGSNTISAAFGLEAGDSLGLVCNRKTGVANTISNLASHCMLASLGDDEAANSRHMSLTTSIARPGGKLGISAGTGRDTLPAWLAGGRGAGNRVEQNDLTVFGQKNIGNSGFVSIGGTVARARLVPATDLPAFADQWNSKSLNFGGGYGPFSANIIGRVVDVPGQPEKWQGLGLGITWRTPWSAQLTVGAENVVTRGKNPFSMTNDGSDEGTVPYVRYEQDL